jgi:hypothetical protein
LASDRVATGKAHEMALVRVEHKLGDALAVKA